MSEPTTQEILTRITTLESLVQTLQNATLAIGHTCKHCRPSRKISEIEGYLTTYSGRVDEHCFEIESIKKEIEDLDTKIFDLQKPE